ncbi:hypothetical protein [Vreelandella subterranea]|nr:hypothetical protein [Halomonas subterranea]
MTTAFGNTLIADMEEAVSVDADYYVTKLTLPVVVVPRPDSR